MSNSSFSYFFFLMIVLLAFCFGIVIGINDSNANKLKNNELIKKYEGVALKSYKDSNNKDVVGYGSSECFVKNGSVITLKTANACLDKNVNNIQSDLKEVLNFDNFTHNQTQAITSLVYNIGFNKFKNTKLFSYLLQYNYKHENEELDKNIMKQWLDIYHTKGYENGLKARRQEEFYYFISK